MVKYLSVRIGLFGEIMKKVKRKFGDRRDAKRIRNLSGLVQISIDLKPNRSVSNVYINQKMDVTKLWDYIQKRKENGDEVTIFHAFVAGFGKLYYNRPYLNRFVANRHVYEHNDVVISFVAKVAFNDRSEEMMILQNINPDDTIDSISKSIKGKIDKYRNAKDYNSKKEGANSAIDFFGKLPNILRIPAVGIFKILDKFGWLPKSFAKDNLYYSSIIVSNLGSIHCGAILHNINDFGNCSALATFGEIHDEEVIENGKKIVKKICEFGVNLDERIADGYYFAKSLQLLQYMFSNPELLEVRADEKIEIKEIR